MKNTVQPQLKNQRQGESVTTNPIKRSLRWFKDRVEFGAYRKATNRLADHLANSRSDNIIKMMKDVFFYLRGSDRVSLFINRKDNGNGALDINPHLSVVRSQTGDITVNSIPSMSPELKQLIELSITANSVLISRGNKVVPFSLVEGVRPVGSIEQYQFYPLKANQTIVIPLTSLDGRDVYGGIVVEGYDIKLRGSLLRRSLRDFVKVVSKITYGLIEATLDHMTGLTKKDKFEKAVYEAAGYYIKTGTNSTVTRYDADNFKRFNDGFDGRHAAGDLVLQHIARIMLRTARSGKSSRDIIGRVGGDEMATLLVTDSAGALKAANRTVSRLRSTSVTLLKVGVPVEEYPTTSVGICDMETARKALELEGKEVTAGTLSKKADELADRAAYQVKEHGRNNVAVASVDQESRQILFSVVEPTVIGTQSV